jgi:CRISPR/Cas system CMR-associated protein Cmr5 small subunit
MRKILASILLLLALNVSAQVETMQGVLKEMPDSMLMYLTKNNVLDLIDFTASKMNAEVDNTLGGKSRMQKLTDRYVSITLNEASSLEMKLLPVKEKVDSANQIVCMVRTYGKDVRESTISFYSVKWRKLDTTDYMDSPEPSMFVAILHEEEDELTLEPVTKLDAPANEEQKETQKVSTNLKWNNKFLNKI